MGEKINVSRSLEKKQVSIMREVTSYEAQIPGFRFVTNDSIEHIQVYATDGGTISIPKQVEQFDKFASALEQFREQTR